MDPNLFRQLDELAAGLRFKNVGAKAIAGGRAPQDSSDKHISDNDLIIFHCRRGCTGALAEVNHRNKEWICPDWTIQGFAR